MSVTGWVLLAVFLTLLVSGGGVAIWAGARSAEGSRGRAGLLAVSASLALAGLVGALVVAAWSPGSGGMGGMMSGNGMGGMTDGSSSASCPSSSAVAAATIQGFRFCPSPLRVQAGTTVTWTNDDNVPHTVTSRTGPQFDSGSLAQGRSWSRRFDQAGTYSYYCAIHPWMTGRIEVRA